MKIHQYNSVDKTLQYSQKELEKILSENISNNVLLLCSGGSALEVLNNISKDVFTHKITVGVLDERFSNDAVVNNFIQLKNTSFYKDAVVSGVNFIESIPRENETLASFGLRMNNNIKKWVNINKKGFIIIIEGMGEDGHTAGIIPAPNDSSLFGKLFDSASTFMVGYSSVSKYPNRVTVTNYFLKKMVDISIVYFVGKEKKEAYKKLMHDSTSKNYEFPIGIVKEMKDVRIFTNIT